MSRKIRLTGVAAATPPEVAEAAEAGGTGCAREWACVVVLGCVVAGAGGEELEGSGCRPGQSPRAMHAVSRLSTSRISIGLALARSARHMATDNEGNILKYISPCGTPPWRADEMQQTCGKQFSQSEGL